jgi:hypothetical protein
MQIRFGKTNKLSSLPDEITQLTGLLGIYVDENAIATFPRQLLALDEAKEPVLKGSRRSV